MMAWAYLQLALAMTMVGANVALGKVIVAELPVFLFSFIRFVLAVLVLVPIVARTEGLRVGLSARQHGILFLQAFFGVFLFSIFMLYGVWSTSAVSAGIITSTIPAMIALLSVLLLRERLGRRTMAGIGLAMLGIAMLNLQVQGPDEAGGASLLGNSLVFAAVVAEALFTILAKPLAGRLSAFKMAAAVNVWGLLLFAPMAAVEAASFDFAAVAPGLWALVVIYAMTASVLSFFFWYRGVARVPAAVAGLFTGVMPVAATLVAIAFLGEVFSPAHAVGMTAVLLAIFMGARPGRRDAPEAAS